MATAAASSSSSFSPSSSAAGASTQSPRHRRNARRAARRPEIATVPAHEAGDGSSSPPQHQRQAEMTDRQVDAVPTKDKKSAWNKPSNGVIEVGPVMGAVTWPALSEAARSSTKSMSSDSLAVLPDGSVSATASYVAASPPLSTTKPAVSSPKANTSSNHTQARQKSMKRGGGGGGGNGNNTNTSGGALANGGTVPLSSPALVETSTKMNLDRTTLPKSSPREHLNRNNNTWDHGSKSGGFMPQNHGGNEHHRNFNHRRGNTGVGGNDGGNFHHNSYGARHNHDRGGYEWNSYRNFLGRDIPLHQPPPPRLPQRPFIIPQPVPAHFIGPPSVRPFGDPVGFHDMNPPFVYMPGPFVPPTFFIPDPHLFDTLLKQIEYYFSPENLCKDIFLRQNMEEEGWVSVSIIANFNRIKQLTNNTKFILDTVRTSSMLEVQGDKIRRRNDWANWLLPPAANQTISASRSETSSSAISDTLATRFNNVALERGAINQNSLESPNQFDGVLHSSSSGEFDRQQEITGNRTGEGNGKRSGQTV